MYIDPGFGGMLIQIGTAIAAAGGVVLFSIRKKIRKLFSKDKKNDNKGVTKAKRYDESKDDIIDPLAESKNSKKK